MIDRVMQHIENAALGIIWGAVPVIACFMAGWWISVPLVPESHIVFYALAGLLAGILIDVIFLREWVRRAYTMKPRTWMAIYMFYSVGMFGFFMGMPVFNVMLALPAGIFVGRWLTTSGANSDRVRQVARQTAVSTTGILGVICITSAAIALLNRSTASEVQHMLSLPFEVTPVMIIGLIVGGGLTLLVLEWWITVTSVTRAYGYFAAQAGGQSEANS